MDGPESDYTSSYSFNLDRLSSEKQTTYRPTHVYSDQIQGTYSYLPTSSMVSVKFYEWPLLVVMARISMQES